MVEMAQSLLGDTKGKIEGRERGPKPPERKAVGYGKKFWSEHEEGVLKRAWKDLDGMSWTKTRKAKNCKRVLDGEQFEFPERSIPAILQKASSFER